MATSVRLALGVLVAICLQAAATAAPQARVSIGAYGDVPRFDRLTGQHSQSRLAYLLGPGAHVGPAV